MAGIELESNALQAQDAHTNISVVGHAERGHRKRTIRTATIILALFSTLFIAALNQTIVATAVPTICAELNSAAGYAWIGGTYLLANGTAAPIWVKISDIFGRKPIILAAVAGYFFSSIICATSINMTMLIAGRAIQGAAGGGLMQLVVVTISDLFSMRSRSLYFAMMELAWTLASGVGPVLGGVFTQYVSWRWIFWINLPVAGAAFFLLLLLLDVHNPRTNLVEGLKAIDWFGSLAMIGLMIMLLLGLNFGGETLPWNSATVVCLIVFGCVMSLVFIYAEKCIAKYPIMPMSLFQSKSNIAILIVGFMHIFVVYATEYYLPLYFQAVQSASPSRSGLLILPLVLTQSAFGVVASVVMHQTGRYVELIWIGMVILTLGNGLYIHLNPFSTIGEVIGFQIAAGIGNGLLFQTPIIAIQAMVTQADMVATATSTLGFVRNLGTCIGIIMGGIVFQNGMQSQRRNLDSAGIPHNVTEMLSGNAAAANFGVVNTLSNPAHILAAKEAFSWSLRNLWIMCTCLGAAGIIASVFIKKTPLSKEHVETKTGLKPRPQADDP